MRTLVTGGTGFIGRHLLPRFAQPVVLSRRGPRQSSGGEQAGVTCYGWQPDSELPPAQALDGVDTVVHLAGESIVGRWTAAKKRRLWDSRVAATANLVKAIGQRTSRPRVLICASAVGYFGSRGDEILDETAGPGTGFLSELCAAWEAAASAAAEQGVRVVLMRTGIVLGRDGGVVSRLLTPFRLGLGGKLGDGRQWMPWIHIDDLVRAILLLIDDTALSGPVNATAPHPVTNAEFTRSLGRALGRPTWCTIPAPVVRLALGEFSQVLLASQRAIPTVLARAALTFQFPRLEQALENILQP